MKHAYFSPSASPRWIPCPASLYLSEKQKEQSQSVYAHEGTVCHDVAAKCLTGNKDASDFAGQVIEEVTMTSELIDGIQLYIDEIRGLASEYSALGGKIEHEVKITENCWGTTDSLLWNPEIVIVADLKMGKGVIVAAEDNPQIMLYAIGSLMWLQQEHNLSPQKVILIIIQPRTVNPIRKHEISREELIKWYKENVVPVLQKHKPGVNSEEDCNPGEIQCRWCPVSATCAGQAHRLINDAQTAFAPFTKVEEPKVEKIEGELDIAELCEYKKVFRHLQNWIKTIETFLQDKALAGETIPGYKLVEGRSNRQWKADEKQVVAFLKNLIAEPYNKKLISPAQAEKALGKKVAKENELENLITKPEGKPTLVLQSDTRPEMQLNVETEFEDFIGDGKETAFVDDAPLIVDDEKDDEEVGGLSALQRMQQADDEPEDEAKDKAPEDTPAAIEKKLVETATGGSDKTVAFSASSDAKAKSPAKTTKRHTVLVYGKGGDSTINEVATVLGCGENMIKMHLRYLNERDGYNYDIYSDGTFKVY